MRHRFAIVALTLCLPLAAKVPLQDVQVTTTDRVDFAPGGAIQITGSIGDFQILGWDEHAVEITVTKSIWRSDTPLGKDQATQFLNRVQVKAGRKGTGELAITTTFPSRNFITRPLRGKTEVNLQYVIRVPRDAHLVIHHDSGDLRLEGLSGAIDATLRVGDIELWQTEANAGSIEAKCAIGGVSSDFDGTHRGKHVVGEAFDHDAPAPAPHVRLRVGLGGIQILKATPAGTAAP